MLAVLKMYKVDEESGEVEMLKKECPEYGHGNFMEEEKMKLKSLIRFSKGLFQF